MGAYGGPWVCCWTEACDTPVIRIHPDNPITLEGDAGDMGVIETGESPLTNRWYKGEVMFPGEKGAVLHFSGVQLSDSSFGVTETTGYWVEVSNAKGRVTSQPVWLLVTELGVAASFDAQGKLF